ncbi:acetyltransferase component of pyruvate dehydrogenase complex [Planctomycetota bacterium]|nr:acetyltransferase component of pyruvate dehydrogenase complex [Planctomycetota bacterium]
MVTPSRRIFATPLARRIARERGINLADIGKPAGQRIYAAEIPEAQATTTSTTLVPSAAVAAPATALGGRVFSTPAARRLARELGLSLPALIGSGPGRRIVAADVLAAPLPTKAGSGRFPAALPSGLPGADLALPFDRMRLAIAERLTRSVRTIPQFTVASDLDCTQAQAWRAAANAKLPREARISLGDLVSVAVARTLVDFPRLNSHVADDRIIIKPTVNLGLAVATDSGGLLVPVLAGAERLTVAQTTRTSRSLIAAARGGRIGSTAVGSFTISNLGALGVTSFQAIVNPPECAILALGAATGRVVAMSGMIAVRSILSVNLTSDHRAVDGAYAAGFLARLVQLFQDSATFGDPGQPG